MADVKIDFSSQTTTSTKGQGEEQQLKRKKPVNTENPLIGVSQEQLLSDVEDFAYQYGLEDQLPLLRKGALIAQAPSERELLESLDESERNALRNESSHRWRQPGILYFTVIMSSVAAVIQGWDQTGSNGANLTFPREFGIADTPPFCHPTNPNAKLCVDRSFLVGFVNSSPYIAIALFAAWISDPLNDYLGRRGTIFLGSIFSLVAPLGSALSQNWGQLVACRILLGIGMGMKEVAVPVFTTESAPTSIRGGLTISWQLWTAFGGVLGFSANLAFHRIGAHAWRYQLGSAFIPAVPLLVGIYLCPESPRWLIKKGRVRDAYRSLRRLRNTDLQAARDSYYIHAQLRQESTLTANLPNRSYTPPNRKTNVHHNSNILSEFLELFTIPRVRRATQASGIIMIAQQMCGVNIIAFYSATIFVQAGYNPTQALLIGWAFKMISFLFTWPSVHLIDKLGRRKLLLSTFPNMAATLLIAGFTFLLPKTSPSRLPLITTFQALFMISYALGEGPIPFAYSAECFPLSHRTLGMAWAVATNNFWAAVLALTLPRMLAAFTPTGTFCFYAGLNLMAFLMIFLFVPETKGRSLEELDCVFGVSTRRHAAFQVREQLPWWFGMWILGGRKREEPQLYSSFRREMRDT